MTTGPEDRGRLRACHADREQVIGTLQAGCVRAGSAEQERLHTRAGQAFAARTYADLAALLADIPGAIRDVGDIPRPPAPAPRQPLARAAVKAGICLIIAAVAVWVASIAVPSGAGPYPDHPFLLPMLLLATIAVVAAPCVLGHGVVTSWKLRRSRGQLPPRPGQDGRALEGERRASTGHDPDPLRMRTDQTHADLRAHKSRQGQATRSRSGSPDTTRREAGARRGMTSVNPALGPPPPLTSALPAD